MKNKETKLINKKSWEKLEIIKARMMGVGDPLARELEFWRSVDELGLVMGKGALEQDLFLCLLKTCLDVTAPITEERTKLSDWLSARGV